MVPRSRQFLIRFGLLLLPVAALSGCASTDTPRQTLRSENPLDRALAVVAVGEARDLEAVHKLVDMLEDSDPGVRFYAILALRRLCGEDHGFQYHADAGTRAAAVQRWRDALRDGTVRIVPLQGGASEAREAMRATARSEVR
jgi:hypothetical protein